MLTLIGKARIGLTINFLKQQRRTMSAFLIDDPKFSFLKELGLDRVNSGKKFQICTER